MLTRNLSILLALSCAAIATATESDTLTLSDGRTLQGMILSQQRDGVEFLEIVQPAGKPTFGVVRNYGKSEIRGIVKADDAARPQLIKRVERLRTRTQIEAENRETIQLRTVQLDEVQYLVAAGDDYDLYSRLDEPLTRRMAVRLEQAFRAYQHMIPPRRASDRRLRILLFDDMREYSDYTATLGAAVRNPAIFLPQDRLILVGADFRRLQQQAKSAGEEHQRQVRWWEQLRRELPARLDAYRLELTAAKVPPDEIEQEVAVRRETFQRQRQEATVRIKAVERANHDSFERAVDDTTRRLYHEAFHAYLECFVFPVADYDVPIWLNEGLAQLFEHGQLEGDAFRIDAPPAELVAELKKRLASTDRPLLAELLDRDSASFVLTTSPHREQLDYALAWGLAWRLVFEERLFEENRLERMVSPGESRRQRLEALLGEPLDQFEPKWREYAASISDR